MYIVAIPFLLHRSKFGSVIISCCIILVAYQGPLDCSCPALGIPISALYMASACYEEKIGLERHNEDVDGYWRTVLGSITSANRYMPHS